MALPEPCLASSSSSVLTNWDGEVGNLLAELCQTRQELEENLSCLSHSISLLEPVPGSSLHPLALLVTLSGVLALQLPLPGLPGDRQSLICVRIAEMEER